MEELRIVRHVLNEFEHRNLTYCHWKSNEHVKEGICGITDLDILVDRKQSEELETLLSDCGFKRFIATFGIRYPGIEDFIGLDDDTGSIVHLHMHYQMRLGEKYLKGYRLPWENTILSTRCWDAENRIYISDPNIELLLLLVRTALKWRFRDRVSGVLGKHYFRGDFKKEYLWLQERIEKDSFVSYCRELVGVEHCETYEKFIGGPFDMREFIRFRHLIRKRFAEFRIFSPAKAFYCKTSRELFWIFSVARKRYLKITLPVRRTLPSNGLIVALIGSDGSGKSTIVKAVVSHFCKKIDATSVYFGSGNGRASLLRYPIKLARNLFLKSKANKHIVALDRRQPANVTVIKKSSLGYQAAKLIWALTLSREKRQKLKNAWKYRDLGMLVITDRYPQTQVKGINDGPLLSEWLTHRNKWLRLVANKELTAYEAASNLVPDLVIRLHVTPEVAASRKTDMTYEEFSKKVDIVNNLNFDTQVINVDATRPLDDVLLEVKRVIWAKIQPTNRVPSLLNFSGRQDRGSRHYPIE